MATGVEELMPAYGAFAYGSAPYGGSGSSPPNASDSWAITDSPTAYRSLSRSASDSFAISDSVSAIWGFDPPAYDSFTISDAARRQVSFTRSANDSWTLHDAGTSVQIPYIDQPTHLALKPDARPLVLRPSDAMVLDRALATLQLQSGAATNTLDSEDRQLAVEDEPAGLWIDGT